MTLTEIKGNHSKINDDPNKTKERFIDYCKEIIKYKATNSEYIKAITIIGCLCFSCKEMKLINN